MNDVYPRALNGKGCLYGQANREQIATLRGMVREMEKKLDKILWALVGVLITLATTSLLLVVNLATGI